MTGGERRWSVAAVDARLAAADRDLDRLAADLGVPVEQVARFARVRDVLLAGRRTGSGVREPDLAAAGVAAGDVVAYMRVSDRILELAGDERDQDHARDKADEPGEGWER